jgi:hypothetical protein
MGVTELWQREDIRQKVNQYDTIVEAARMAFVESSRLTGTRGPRILVIDGGSFHGRWLEELEKVILNLSFQDVACSDFRERVFQEATDRYHKNKASYLRYLKRLADTVIFISDNQETRPDAKKEEHAKRIKSLKQSRENYLKVSI